MNIIRKDGTVNLDKCKKILKVNKNKYKYMNKELGILFTLEKGILRKTDYCNIMTDLMCIGVQIDDTISSDFFTEEKIRFKAVNKYIMKFTWTYNGFGNKIYKRIVKINTKKGTVAVKRKLDQFGFGKKTSDPYGFGEDSLDPFGFGEDSWDPFGTDHVDGFFTNNDAEVEIDNQLDDLFGTCNQSDELFNDDGFTSSSTEVNCNEQENINNLTV